MPPLRASFISFKPGTGALLALLLALPAGAQKFAGPLKSQSAAASGDRVFVRLEVKAEYAGMSYTADFATLNATQANYVKGGDRAVRVATAQGEALEFKKWGFICNVLPVVDPSDLDLLDVQIQVEVSGPVDKEGLDIRTWQVQNEVLARAGEWTKFAWGDGTAQVRWSRLK